MFRHFRDAFWAGLLVRLVCSPFLLSWYHPDERQMLEFAHFHAHGRLHPFMESQIHLRNQTLPWLFSWVIKASDHLGWDQPWAYLTLIQALLSVWSWLGLCALIEAYYVRYPSAIHTGRRLAWFFALFWAFPFLYSRQLLEAASLPAACFLFLASRRLRLPGDALRAGFWGGVTAWLRYPSALLSLGGFFVGLFKLTRPKRPVNQALVALGLAVLGAAVAILVGGIADWRLYGGFLSSAQAFWEFNQPHGPVESIFGNDSLIVYWRWFQFVFTPLMAAFFLAWAALALTKSWEILIFLAPYVLGHLWTPHREPRFMIPLLPFLALAIAEWRAERDDLLQSAWLRRAFWAFAGIHIALNFAWYPLQAWTQWTSSQGTLIRHYSDLRKEPSDLINLGAPLIDAIVPPEQRWADSLCRWHRPANSSSPSSEIWILSGEKPSPHCTPRFGELLPPAPEALQRVSRSRAGALYRCNREVLSKLCPQGLSPESKNEPSHSL